MHTRYLDDEVVSRHIDAVNVSFGTVIFFG